MKKMVLFLLAAVMLSASGAEWQKNYEVAVKTAVEQMKPVMILFTAPGWCGYCVRMEKNLFPQTGFKKVMEKTVPVMLDFSKRNKVTKAMNDLSRKFNVRGFPTLIITDAKGKVLGEKVGFDGDIESYINDLNRFIGK